MSDPFERHGIDHLSPTSLKLFRAAPAVWIGKYLLKAPDEAGPAAWRGRAVEAGVDQLLFGHNMDSATRAMRTQWDNEAQGVIDRAAEEEFASLDNFLLQAKIAFADQSVPTMRQSKISLSLPGISIPLIGYIDYLWQGKGFERLDDLKTTWRLPSTPDPTHIEQVSCYALHTGLPANLTYVTPKKWTRFEIIRPMLDEGYERVVENAHALKSFLNHVDNAHDALSMFSPDYTSYWFKPSMVEAVRTAKAVVPLPFPRVMP